MFVTANRLGDAVLSTGLLDHLIRSHPGARITVACGPVAEGVFARMPGRARTIVLAKRRFRAHWLALLAAALPVRWDLVVDLRGSALAWLLRARRRAVMRGGRRPGHRIGHLAAVLGLQDAPPLPVAWTAEADRARAAALLPEADGPWIGLGPTANWARKVWPAERFVALYRALSAPDGPLPGARAAVFGGPGEAERALAAPLLAALPEAADLVGRLEVPEAAAALARCALFVGNDSGPMHLAAAAGAPTLGLFGPTSAEEYGPVGARAAAVAAPGAPAAGAMAAIGVADALAAARRLLGAAPQGPCAGRPGRAAAATPAAAA
nr:glycosyltransferase family 9 protein [Caldovatus aquaticus]